MIDTFAVSSLAHNQHAPGHGAASSLLVVDITGCLPGAGRETELGRVDWMWRMFDKSSSAFCLKISVVSGLKIKNANNV